MVTLTEAFFLLLSFCSSVSSFDLGFFCGICTTTPCGACPWNPESWCNTIPPGKSQPSLSIIALSCTLPSYVLLKNKTRPFLVPNSTFFTLCAFFYHCNVPFAAQSHQDAGCLFRFHP